MQDVGSLLAQVGIGVADQGRQGHTFATQQRHQHLYFRRVAAFADGYHKILGLNHAQVAMNGIGGVHEQGRRAGAVERGHDFAGYMGAFANARDHHAALERQNGLYAVHKVGGGGKGHGYVVQSRGFFVQHLPGNGQHIGCRKRGAGNIGNGIRSGNSHSDTGRVILQNWGKEAAPAVGPFGSSCQRKPGQGSRNSMIFRTRPSLINSPRPLSGTAQPAGSPIIPYSLAWIPAVLKACLI